MSEAPTVEDVDALVDAERFREARETIERARAASTDTWRFLLRHAELVLGERDTPVDEAILTAERLLAPDGVPFELELGRAHAVRVDGYARKRCRGLAEEAAKRSREAVGADSALRVAEGDLALAFDDRPRARALYEEAIATDAASPEARLAMANLLYVLGDFDACEKMLATVDGPPAAIARRERFFAACAAARSDHATEAEAWQRALDAVPKSDRHASDRIGLGLALAVGGDRAGALEALRAVWRSAPDSGPGRYARLRVEHLEKSTDAKVKRLAAFPTVAQRWNYCGPAVIELCFRYLGIDLRQDEIADAVKRERGTPMFEISSFLARHGLLARRIAATPERLRAAIDLGLPVIVQEEYSTTSHVAVVTGYDAGLGVFFSADPATHRPIVKPFEWTARAGDLFGSGGIVVLGRTGSATDAIAAKADAAGLVDQEHLLLLDRASELRPEIGAGGALEEAVAEEVLGLCDRALALEPSFKLAWHRRIWARLSLYWRDGSAATRSALLADLHHVRTAWPNDEWPHQLHGRFLFDDGRWDEAFVAYFDAWRRDPDDSNDLQYMGEAKWLSGDLLSAEKHTLAALAAEPFNERASETLGGALVRQLQLFAAERSDESDGPWPSPPPLSPPQVTLALERDEDEIRRRARHFVRVALAHHPDNPFNHELEGYLAEMDGRFEEAAAAFRRSRELTPGRSGTLIHLARALESLERYDEARELLEQGVRDFARYPAVWLDLGRHLDSRGEHAKAAETLLAGIDAVGPAREGLVEPLFGVLSRAESREAAAARMRELAEKNPSDGDFLHAVAHLLDREHQRGHAIALLRNVVARAPGDLGSQYRLGQLLAEDLLTRDEGRSLLERVMEHAPESSLPRVQLAWHLVDEQPERGLELLSPVRERDDPRVLDVVAALLERRGDAEQADRVLERALEAHGSPVEGLITLAWGHISAHRYDRALRLVELLDSRSDVPPARAQAAQRVWLTAHRLGGDVRSILPRLSELTKEGVPPHLAWELYWATRSFDHALAAKAALAQVEREDDPDERVEWRIYAAEELAEAGDPSLLASVVGEAGDRAAAWARLSWAYAAVHRWGEANDAAKRALELGPEDRDALTVMQGVHVRLGDLDAAIACARKLLDVHPYEHQGAERLGILLGKSLDIEPALAYSHRAVDAAPFCHVSQQSRAIALFGAGDLEGARRHAERATGIEAPDMDEPDDDHQILAAIRGEVDELERCFAQKDRHGFPVVFPRWRDKLRDVAAHAARARS